VILKRIHKDSIAPVFTGVLLLKLFADDVHLALRLGRRDSRLESSDHLEPIADAALIPLINRKRRPEFTFFVGKCEARWHDTDYGEVAAVEIEHFALNAGTPEAALPQTPAD
jgi:hypothetical protein